MNFSLEPALLFNRKCYGIVSFSIKSGDRAELIETKETFERVSDSCLTVDDLLIPAPSQPRPGHGACYTDTGPSAGTDTFRLCFVISQA